jgi:hypothetical protein
MPDFQLELRLKSIKLEETKDQTPTTLRKKIDASVVEFTSLMEKIDNYLEMREKDLKVIKNDPKAEWMLKLLGEGIEELEI